MLADALQPWAGNDRMRVSSLRRRHTGASEVDHPTICTAVLLCSINHLLNEPPLT